MMRQFLLSILFLGTLSAAPGIPPQLAPSKPNSGSISPQRDSDARKRLEEAKRELKRNPRSGYWHNQAGLLYMQLKKPNEGLQELRLATDNEPKVAFYQACVGTFLYRNGDLAGAEASWRKALALDQKNPILHFELGRALEDQHQVAVAVEEYQRSLSALSTVSTDASGKNYLDPDGSYFSIDGLRDAILARLRALNVLKKE